MNKTEAAYLTLLKKAKKDKQSRVMDSLARDLYGSKHKISPKKNAAKNHVGIEIECYTNLPASEMIVEFIELGIDKYIQLASDGSIDVRFGRDLELRVCAPENMIQEVLLKLNKFFKKHKKKFGVNSSCGIHVHLDMRKRDYNASLTKLIKLQDILFGLVGEGRWNNSYCHYTHANSNGRYMAINRLSYMRHKTIEVRLHEGTLDMDKISKWTRLLMMALTSSEVPTIRSKKDAVKWVEKDKVLKGYVSKTFKEKWLERRATIVANTRPYVSNW